MSDVQQNYRQRTSKVSFKGAEVYPKCIRGVAEVQPNNMADVRPAYSQSVYCKCTSSLAMGALVEMPPKYISKVHLKYSRSIFEVYSKCTLSITEVARRLAEHCHAAPASIAAAVPLLRHGRCAELASRLPCHSRLSLLLCHSRIPAAVARALASLLLWRSRVAAAVRLLHS